MIAVRLTRKHLTAPTRKSVKCIEHEIWQYLTQTNTLNRYRTVHTPQQKYYAAAGTQFDLYDIFDSLNREYFSASLSSYMRWGRFGSKTSYHTQIQDEHGIIHNLITIAGLYNHPSVPSYAVRAVTYHEMLHIACPPMIKNGRRRVHHRDFKNQEKRFGQYDSWQKWLRKKAPYLLFKGRV
jgi:hypothetical protein